MKKRFTIDNRIVQEADNMAKETHLPFRDCLDILVSAHLAGLGEVNVAQPEPASYAIY